MVQDNEWTKVSLAPGHVLSRCGTRLVTRLAGALAGRRGSGPAGPGRDTSRQRVLARLPCGSTRPDRRSPPDLLQDRHDDSLEGRRAVLLVHGAEHALAARLPDKIAQYAVVD